MAKIFYVTETTPDYAQVNFFKTEKEALEYGISELPQFDMFDEPTNDEEADGDEWYQGDSLTFKKGILFSFEADGTFVQAMEDAEAREYAEDLGDEGGAIFFEGFTKGMYGYLGNGADGKNIKWDWDGQEINESTSTGRLKHVKLFEQFINEGVNRKNLKEVQKIGFDDAYLEDGAIVLADTGINPWNDEHEYTFYWDGESVWCNTDETSGEYAEEVTTADKFTDVIYNSDNWE